MIPGSAPYPGLHWGLLYMCARHFARLAEGGIDDGGIELLDDGSLGILSLP